MKKLLLESIDNESRKGALAFLKNNFKRCFTLDQQDLPDDKKEKLCQEYVKKNEVEYCLTWDVGGCNWTKALIMAVVRILKTECNDETSRPVNTRMKERLKKVHFAAMMYRQKQVWDGVPKEQILSKDANGMNFYRLSALVMPMYEELKDIYLNGYGNVWQGKEAEGQAADRRKAEKEEANKRRYQELLARVENGEQLAGEEKAFFDRITAKLAQQNAPVEQVAAVQPELEPTDEELEDPWAEDNGFTAEHPRPYMKGRFKIGNNGYWAVRIDTYEQSKTWWYWTYPNVPDPHNISLSWCITNPNSNNFNIYGIGTSVTGYYVFKEGFEKLQRPRTNGNAPYDDWGKSLLCIMIDRNFSRRSNEVYVCASRYNQAKPDNTTTCSNGFGNGFFNKKVESIAQLFGCTKEEIYDKFEYKLANQVNQAADAPNDEVTKNLLKQLNSCNDEIITKFKWKPTYAGEDEGGYKVMYNNFTAFYHNGTFVTPWVKILGAYTDTDKVYLSYVSNDRYYFTDVNGTPLFNEILDSHWGYENTIQGKYHVFKNYDANLTLILNGETKKWVNNNYIAGRISSVRYPYFTFYDNNLIYELIPNKNILIPANDKLSRITGDANIKLSNFIETNKNFICKRHSTYIVKTGETIQFENPVRLNDDFIRTNDDKKLLTSKGKIVDLDTIKEKLADYGNSISNKFISQDRKIEPYILYRGKNNIDHSVKFCLVNKDGEIIEKVIPDCGPFIDYYKQDDETIYITSNTKKIVVNIKNAKRIEVTNTFTNCECIVKYSQNRAYFITRKPRKRPKIYNSKGELLLSIPDEISTRAGIADFGTIGKNDNITIVKLDRFGNKATFIQWKNNDTPVQATENNYRLLGNDYVYIKDGDTAKIYDDTGKLFLSGKYTINACFKDGYASLVDNNGNIIYFNTDNEYSDTIEELLESARLKNRTRLDIILEAAAYLC